MKKLIVILITAMLLVGCRNDYHCIVKYEVNYPDTSWVHTYEFDGGKCASASVSRNSIGREQLLIYEHQISFGYNIAIVPKDSDCNIKILDYKMYKKGHDIDLPEE